MFGLAMRDLRGKGYRLCHTNTALGKWRQQKLMVSHLPLSLGWYIGSQDPHHSVLHWVQKSEEDVHTQRFEQCLDQLSAIDSWTSPSQLHFCLTPINMLIFYLWILFYTYFFFCSYIASHFSTTYIHILHYIYFIVNILHLILLTLISEVSHAMCTLY